MYIPAKTYANLIRILQKSLLFSFQYFLLPAFSLAQISGDSLLQYKTKLQDSIIRSGYWEARVEIDDKNNIKIQKGQPYVWQSIQAFDDKSRVEILFLNKVGGEIADQYELEKKLSNYVRSNYHRHGYPFAKANLTIMDLDDNQVKARVNINPQNFIVYDSLIIKGDSQFIDPIYLSNLLDLKYNEPFDISAYAALSDKIDQLDYFRLGSAPELSFANNRAKITLRLEKVKTNQFDALIGFVPDGERTNITGQVDARLSNLFRRGVNLDVFWQKYSASSQFLNTNIQQSYAFKSPLGLNLGFELLQEDSTFLQTDLQLGTSYPLLGQLNVGIAYQRLSTNVLRDFTEQEIVNLNPFRSSTTNAVCLNLRWKSLLTYPQLKNHIFGNFNFGLGSKRIANFTALPTTWQNVPQLSNSINGGFKLHLQKTFWKRFLIEAIPQYSFVQNPALSQNDLLRLGGLQNLRGFDRNFFYTRYFGLLNLNYRYFLDQRSSFFLLTDFAKLQSNIGWLYAVGAGVDIKSNNGWFRIIYALGNQMGNKPDFSQGKVHFGYIAVF